MTAPQADPLVSVGIPVFNGENYLRECIQSMVDQTYRHIEIVISDNGSTDGTEEICREAASRDDRIRYLRWERNRGAAWNYNEVFRQSTGELFTWAAHDDVRLPDNIARCISAFDGAGDDVVLVYPRAEFIDADGRVTGADTDCMANADHRPHRRLAKTLMTVNLASPVFGLIRSDALGQTRLIDSFTASDYALLVELSLLGKFVEVPDVLFRRRMHPESSRAANLTRASVTAWFDPHARPDRFLSTRQRLVVEYSRSVLRLPLAPGERARCIAAVPLTLAYRRARVTGGRWRSTLAERARPRLRGADDARR